MTKRAVAYKLPLFALQHFSRKGLRLAHLQVLVYLGEPSSRDHLICLPWVVSSRSSSDSLCQLQDGFSSKSIHLKNSGCEVGA